MSENDWFVMRPQKAQANGRPEGDGFLVRKDSTAMREGSPSVKRDREERDRLVRQGILVPDSDPDLYRFSRDHLFPSASMAGGVVKDGNCSGPQTWRRSKGRENSQGAFLNNIFMYRVVMYRVVKMRPSD